MNQVNRMSPAGRFNEHFKACDSGIRVDAALFHPLELPKLFLTGVYVLTGATALHLFCVGFWGRLPRFAGFVLVAVYGYFLKAGLLG